MSLFEVAAFGASTITISRCSPLGPSCLSLAHSGESLKTFATCFPRAGIVGIDIEDRDTDLSALRGSLRCEEDRSVQKQVKRAVMRGGNSRKKVERQLRAN
jgi:hypothetical protein